jgi:hypothetical protein
MKVLALIVIYSKVLVVVRRGCFSNIDFISLLYINGDDRQQPGPNLEDNEKGFKHWKEVSFIILVYPLK